MMIYSIPKPQDILQQGDIFRCIPRVELSMNKLMAAKQVDGSVNTIETTWRTEVEDKQSIVYGLLPIKPVYAIVVTQDCDASRSMDISLCEIRIFSELFKTPPSEEQHSKWIKVITKESQLNQKWYYLPACSDIGFNCRMGVDFMSIIRVNRIELEEMREDYRVAKLNDEVAKPHFRERIANFFRRYPYNEWYPFNKKEFEAYTKDKDGPVEPYEWHK